jgi:hypothetical protein
MYQLYTFAKVTAITIHLDLASSTTTPFLVAGGVLPYSGASTVGPSDLAGQADSKVTLASVFQKTRLRWSLPVEKFLGNVFQSSQFWINKAQSLSTSPVSVDEPTFVWLTQHPTGATMDYIWQMVITYHVQFFDPVISNLSLEFEPVQDHDQQKKTDSSRITEFIRMLESGHK